MAKESTTCTICGRKKSTAGTGSFTQWLAVCRCDQLTRIDTPILTCSKCGLPPSTGDSGSFTQWVFRPKACKCEQPGLSARSLVPENNKPHDQGTTGTTDGAGASMSLDPAIFPVDRYRPIRKLGTGGIGTVYLCFDERLNKEVAVKVLKVATEEQLVSFQTEARVMAKLNHPNIVSILDFGITEHGAPYMVLEHVEGTALDVVLEKNGNINEHMALMLCMQIVDALEHAHALSVFHRDIKTSNVLVSLTKHNELNAHVIDFGIAFLQDTQHSAVHQGKTLVGTPRYMSPDQLLGRRFDPRSEVYSLGCLMYEMLSGRVPFNSEDPLALLEMHASKPVPPFSEVCPDLRISNKFESVVNKCLEKDPDSRFQDMVGLRNALKDLVSGQDLTIEGPLYVVAPQPKTPRAIIFVAVLLLVTGFIAYFAWINRQPVQTFPVRLQGFLGSKDEELASKIPLPDLPQKSLKPKLVTDSSSQESMEQRKARRSFESLQAYDALKAGNSGSSKNSSSVKLDSDKSKSASSSTPDLSRAGVTLGALSSQGIPALVSEVSTQYIEASKSKPLIKKILQDPDLNRAWNAERLAHFHQSDIGTFWDTDENFLKLFPKLKSLWGDPNMVSVFSDQQVYQYFRDSNNWKPQKDKQIRCPDQYKANPRVQTLVTDPRFRALAPDPNFHRLMDERVLKNFLSEADNWRMMIVYFVDLASSKSNKLEEPSLVSKGTNPGSWFLTNPSPEALLKLSEEADIDSIFVKQFKPQVVNAMPVLPITSLVVYQKHPKTIDQLNFSALKRLPRLTNLEVISSESLTTSHLDSIASITSLKLLGLNSGKTISQNGLSRLKRLRNLKVLILEYNKSIDDSAIKCLTGLSSLEQIWLSHTRVTSNCLADLAKLKHLRFIDISSSPASKGNLMALAGLGQLQELKIGRYNKWQGGSSFYDWRSNKDCAQLKEKLPNLRFTSRAEADDQGATVRSRKNIYSGDKPWLD